jgi:hypothetical protein
VPANIPENELESLRGRIQSIAHKKATAAAARRQSGHAEGESDLIAIHWTAPWNLCFTRSFDDVYGPPDPSSHAQLRELARIAEQQASMSAGRAIGCIVVGEGFEEPSLAQGPHSETLLAQSGIQEPRFRH